MIALEGMPERDHATIAALLKTMARLEIAQGADRPGTKSTVKVQTPLELELVNALATELKNPGAQSHVYTKSLRLALTISLIRNHPAKVPDHWPSRGGLAPGQLRRVHAYFKQKLAANVSISEVAALVGLSQSHFSRAFRISTGLPPHRYQMLVRTEQAKHLLLHTELSLDAIAVDCGFCDKGHLSKIFRLSVGISPGAWRKEQSV